MTSQNGCFLDKLDSNSQTRDVNCHYLSYIGSKTKTSEGNTHL